MLVVVCVCEIERASRVRVSFERASFEREREHRSEREREREHRSRESIVRERERENRHRTALQRTNSPAAYIPGAGGRAGLRARGRRGRFAKRTVGF